MEEQQTQQSDNRERFNDDPGALMGLLHLEKISEFWKRYDRLADITDKKMTSNLSENLDVLLIFAALFSAINTAFISLTMPALSSDPLAETNTLLRLLVTKVDNTTLRPADLSPAFSPSSNSIVVNCLLYASLSCSLLAAVGAMMAKEWLQSFDRTGQTGPLEEQGRFRQRKYYGAQRWHLEAIIQFLPNLLLLYVMLFFAGVCLFLLPANKAAAGVWWKRLLRTVIDLAVVKVSQLISKAPNVVRHTSRNVSADLELIPSTLLPTTLREAGTPEEVVTAQAARWLLGTTSNHGDQIAAAQFIRTLNNTACAFVFEDWETWRRLVSLTHQAFDIWYSQPSEGTQRVAELFGLASSRVLLQFSNDAIKRKDITDLLLDRPRSFGGTYWQAFEFALTRYSCYIPGDSDYVLHIAFISTILSKGTVVQEYKWHELARFFSTRTYHLVDVLLGLWAICLCNVGSDGSYLNRSHALTGLMEVGENNSILVQNLWNAVASGGGTLPSVRGDLQFELNIARGYRYCLRRALELSPRLSPWEPDKAAHKVTDLICSFIDPLSSSDSGKSSTELARLSVEAVFALHGLIMRNPCTNDISVSQDSQSEQLLDDHLIDAVVGMMLDGFKSLTSPELVRERVQVEDEWLLQERQVPPPPPPGEEQEKWKRERERERREREQKLEQRERERALAVPRARALARERGPAHLRFQRELLRRMLAGSLHKRVKWSAKSWVLALERGLQLLVESCLIRILLRAWKTTLVTQLDHSASHGIFTSSCQLWAPLEAAVDLTKNGIKFGNRGELLTGFNEDNQDKLLTSNDLEMIVEFIEYLQKDREKSAFIAQNADVGINRLYVHLDRQEDWDYELYDLREPRTLCSRSINTEDGMA